MYVRSGTRCKLQCYAAETLDIYVSTITYMCYEIIAVFLTPKLISTCLSTDLAECGLLKMMPLAQSFYGQHFRQPGLKGKNQ